MYISRLALDHFRSWHHCVIDFEPGVTILHGANGLGKTNLVEAIEVLSTGASHRTSSLRPLIAVHESRATVRANVTDSNHTITYEATLSARGANRARINGGPSLYLRDVVGRVPSVTFAPEDQRLVSGDPAGRRTFLDQAGVLLIPGYAECMQTVTRIARQRAALLRTLAERGREAQLSGVAAPDPALSGLEVWTGQFIQAGTTATRYRNMVVQQLAEPFARIVAELAGEQHHAVLEYMPSFVEALEDEDPAARIAAHFRRIYPGEVARGVNLIGPQRDDVAVTLNGMPAREYASNGELWTLALALRMALFETVAQTNGVTPVVILDDVFAQLDNTRRAQILAFAREQPQVLVTVAATSDIPDGTDMRLIDVGMLAKAEAGHA